MSRTDRTGRSPNRVDTYEEGKRDASTRQTTGGNADQRAMFQARSKSWSRWDMSEGDHPLAKLRQTRARMSIYVADASKKHHHRLSTGEGHPWPCIRRLVVSTFFEALVSGLIIANCIFIGWQAEQHEEGPLTEVIEHFFTGAFTLELFLQVLARGWTYLVHSESFLDVFLVCQSIFVTWILVHLNIGLTFFRKLTVLRTLRLIRLARAVKHRAEFKEMWALLRGVMESGETMFWTYVMIGSVLYFFAIMATSLIGKSASFQDNAIAQEYFGDVLKSMLTLFQVMTLDSWTSIMRPLMKVHWWVVIFFVVFISLAEFVLMNLVTAVIVEHAFSDSKNEEKELAKELERETEKELEELQYLFNKIDFDGSGKLSREELYRAMKNKKILNKLQKLDIMSKDIDELWEILDDGDGELDSQEFIDGIIQLRGEAKSKDILRLYREVRVLENSCDVIEQNLHVSVQRMHVVGEKLARARKDLAATQRTMMRAKEAVKLAPKTQPLS